MAENEASNTPPPPPKEAHAKPGQTQPTLKPIPSIAVKSDRKSCMILEGVEKKQE